MQFEEEIELVKGEEAGTLQLKIEIDRRMVPSTIANKIRKLDNGNDLAKHALGTLMFGEKEASEELKNALCVMNAICEGAVKMTPAVLMTLNRTEDRKDYELLVKAFEHVLINMLDVIAKTVTPHEHEIKGMANESISDTKDFIKEVLGNIDGVHIHEVKDKETIDKLVGMLKEKGMDGIAQDLQDLKDGRFKEDKEKSH